MNYEYKTVPAPNVVATKNSKQSIEVIKKFGVLITSESVDGWRFHSMHALTAAESAGCLSFGKQNIVNYNMFVFEREIP